MRTRPRLPRRPGHIAKGIIEEIGWDWAYDPRLQNFKIHPLHRRQNHATLRN